MNFKNSSVDVIRHIQFSSILMSELLREHLRDSLAPKNGQIAQNLLSEVGFIGSLTFAVQISLNNKMLKKFLFVIRHCPNKAPLPPGASAYLS
jgi:hypothetical protein